MQADLFSRIKEFIIDLCKSRLIVLIAVFFAMFLIIVQRLFNLQIVEGEKYLDDYTLQIMKEIEVQGTRGNIYDRNGQLLATNRLAYSVQIEDNGSYEDTKQKNEVINDTINRVIDMIESNGDAVINDFGIILDGDHYQYLHDEGTRRNRFIADVYGHTKIDDMTPEELASTPEDIMNFLCANKRETSKGVSYGFEHTCRNGYGARCFCSTVYLVILYLPKRIQRTGRTADVHCGQSGRTFGANFNHTGKNCR